MPGIGFRLASLLLALTVLVSSEPTVAAAVTATLVVLVAAVMVGAASVPGAVPVAASTLRRQARRTAFLPQLHPDAPGRPRPRAPSPA